MNFGVAIPFVKHVNLMRVVSGVHLRSSEGLNDLLTAVFQATWIDDLDLNDAALTSRTLANAGFSQAEVEVLLGDPQVTAALRAATDEAVSGGVLGAPTTFVDDELLFGQDKLDLGKEELAS